MANRCSNICAVSSLWHFGISGRRCSFWRVIVSASVHCYWTQQSSAGGDWLLFASEIKALLASGMVPARPDPRGINHIFTFFALPGAVTCFEGRADSAAGTLPANSPGASG